MKVHLLRQRWALWALLCAPLLWSTHANAMPSYARQTGLDCDSCHIGFEPVPDFTRTGRLFIMRGFHQPTSNFGAFRENGYNNKDQPTPHYGGNYLALNWEDFFSMRFIGTLLASGKAAGATTTEPVTTNAAARLAMYFTGPITDWLGIWDEIGYLANNTLPAANNTTTSGQTAGSATNLNLFAWDEYRLVASRMVGGDSFVSLALGNECPDAINEFVFPVGNITPWCYGQGGVGKEYSTTAVTVDAFIKNQMWVQYSAMTGDADGSWSNGHINYFNLAYDGVPGTGDFFRRESMDFWFVAEAETGTNFGSTINPVTTSLICSTTVNNKVSCPAGISDTSGLSFSNTDGSFGAFGDLAKVNGTGYETSRQDTAWKFSLHSSVADWGNQSWYQELALDYHHQGYVSGASSTREQWGYSIRYFYNRTYGFRFGFNGFTNNSYVSTAGVRYDAYRPVTWYTTLLWVPAMNVQLALNYSPSVTAELLPADNHLATGGDSWSLLVDYGF